MRIFIATLLILSVILLSGVQAVAAVPSTPLTLPEMATITGTGFWGGVACGAAVGGIAVGTGAAITALGAGTTFTLGMAFAYSVALHAGAICALID